MTKPDYKKITQVLNYITAKAGDGGKINYMKALKLLYMADRLHLRMYGRLITDDMLVAMKKGTLGSQAKDIVLLSEDTLSYDAYKYSEHKIKRDRLDEYLIEKNYKETDNLSETDIECVDRVVSVVGDKNEFDLAELTHQFPEWKRHEYVIKKRERLVVPLEIVDLFDSTDNSLLNKIYSQSEEDLRLSKSLFSESIEQDKYLV